MGILLPTDKYMRAINIGRVCDVAQFNERGFRTQKGVTTGMFLLKTNTNMYAIIE